MIRASLRTKVSLYLFVTLSVTMIPFIYLVVKYAQDDLMRTIAQDVTHLAGTVVRSTRHAMMRNEREIVAQIIADISTQKGIEQLRVIDAAGQIIHSDDPKEVGQTVARTEGDGGSAQ